MAEQDWPAEAMLLRALQVSGRGVGGAGSGGGEDGGDHD